MNFPKKITEYNLVWIGEVHGIRENYHAYKAILPTLFEVGFKNILWEMPADFSGKSKNSDDGRINSFSVVFLKWIQDQIKIGKIEKLTLFGNKKGSDYEETMAEEMLDIIGDNRSKKYVIISGNYHMQRLGGRSDKEKRCIDYLEEKTDLKIVTIELKYTHGTFYNYGVKKIPNRLSARGNRMEADPLSLSVKDENSLELHIGEAHAVSKNPTT